MKHQQFVPTPLVCPHCGHVIGEQAYFQGFETKVAAWLQGSIAPPATKGFDVYKSPHIPDKTFQVKYAHAYRFQPKGKKYAAVNWTWICKSLDPVHPDFFILFGIDEDQQEHCFLLSRNDFINYANHQPNRMYLLRVSSKKKSERENYNYIPKIWHYVVEEPELNLIDRILNYQPGAPAFMVAAEHIDEIRALSASGVSQQELAKRFGVGQTTISRWIRNDK